MRAFNASRARRPGGTVSLPGAHAGQGLSRVSLRWQNRRHRADGGVSCRTWRAGFVPAFLDPVTGAVLPSCFRDGTRAPVHCLDGLPAALVLRRDADGRVAETVAGLVAGFARGGRFYSRAEAAATLSREVHTLD